MNLRCKPGDIAISVGTRLPENNGVFVEVLEFAGEGIIVHAGHFYGDFPPSWIVRITAGACTIETSAGRHWKLGPGDTVPWPDCTLHPICPPAKDTTTTETKEREHETQ